MNHVTWGDYQEWLGDVAIDFNAPAVDPPQPGQINRDSRQISRGDFYVAIKGEKYDGHGFINHAIDQGASCFLYEDSVKVNPANFSKGIKVKDSITALQRIGAGYLATLSAKKIAITGSVGKTTCKQLTASILAGTGNTLASPASYNNEIGVPLTMLSATSQHEFIVFECGARHEGDIKLLVELIQPDVAVVLNAGKAHVAEFGSLEKAVATKGEMFQFAPAEAIRVAPADQADVLEMARATGGKLTSFGHEKNANVCISASNWQDNGDLAVSYIISGHQAEVIFKQGHEALAINGAAAAAVAHALDIDVDTIMQQLGLFESGEGRFKIHKLDDYTVIDDSYNASPTSMTSGFKSCQKLFPAASKVVVLGDMLELGDSSQAAHHQVGAECYQILKPDLLITVGEASKDMVAGAVEAGHPKDKVFAFDKVEQAIGLPARVFQKRDVIYLKGSNSVNLKSLVTRLLHPQE